MIINVVRSSDMYIECSGSPEEVATWLWGRDANGLILFLGVPLKETSCNVGRIREVLETCEKVLRLA